MMMIENLIKQDPEKAMDKNQNLTRSTDLLFIGFGTKLMELIFIIFTMAYLCGILWIVQCELLEDFYYDTVYQEMPKDLQPPSFLTHYNLTDMPPSEVVIISLYYTLTSLSTIGFGDFVPQNSIERVVCSFILLFGVAIFSYIMNCLLELVNQYNHHVGDFDDGDELNRFFGTLTKFNKNKALDQSFMNKYEEYFNFRWTNFKNQAF